MNSTPFLKLKQTSFFISNAFFSTQPLGLFMSYLYDQYFQSLSQQVNIYSNSSIQYEDMVPNIFTVNKKKTRIDLFLSIFGFIVIFQHILNLVSFSLILNVHLPVQVVSRRATFQLWTLSPGDLWASFSLYITHCSNISCTNDFFLMKIFITD